MRKGLNFNPKRTVGSIGLHLRTNVFFHALRMRFPVCLKLDGCKGAVTLQNKDILHVGRIGKGDALFWEVVIHGVFCFGDGNNAVRGDSALCFQKEEGVNLLRFQTAALV